MNRRPLEITTPTHGMALTAYACASLLGLSFLLGLSESAAMTNLIGPLGTVGWAVSTVMCGWFALVCCIGAGRRMPRLRIGLIGELITVSGIAFCLGLYLVAITLAGWPDLLTYGVTKLLAVTYVLGGVIRAAQIGKELRRLRAGLDHPQVADPAPLAEPDK